MSWARPRAFQTIVIGGGIAGILDGLDAVIYYHLSFGTHPVWLFQNIASGLLGKRSFSGGLGTMVLGVALHFTVAFGAASFYFFMSRGFPVLYRYPWIFGPAFGVGLYLFMQHVVIPLSLVHKRVIPAAWPETLDQLFSHMVLVGLPIALMAKKSAGDDPHFA